MHTAAALSYRNNPELMAHHLMHASGHAQVISSHLVKLRDHVARKVPGVARELADLDKAIPRKAAEGKVPRAALDMSIAHDIASGQAAVAHTARHLTEAQAANGAGDRVSAVFNIEHASRHVGEVNHYMSELDKDLKRRLPPVEAETVLLDKAQDPPEPPRLSPRSYADYDVADRGPVPA